MSSVSYTGVMLDDKSREYLFRELGHLVPDGWDWIAHHMTITLGKSPSSMLGDNVNLAVVSLGIDDKVIAIGVEGYYSKNTIPHVTLAVDRVNGGKPVMSNHIPEHKWKPYKMDKLLTGIVEEYPKQKL